MALIQKTAKIVLLITLLMGGQHDLLAQAKSDSKVQAEIRKDARRRARLKQRQGWVPVVEVGGTARSQFGDLINLELENQRLIDEGLPERYLIESQIAMSLNPTIARSKARDAGRKSLAKNLGSAFSGRIETGELFINASNEDITSEIETAAGAFDEFFGHELSRNKLVTCFTKEDGGYTIVELTVVIDRLELEAAIKSISKADLQQRIGVLKQVYKAESEREQLRDSVDAQKREIRQLKQDQKRNEQELQSSVQESKDLIDQQVSKISHRMFDARQCILAEVMQATEEDLRLGKVTVRFKDCEQDLVECMKELESLVSMHKSEMALRALIEQQQIDLNEIEKGNKDNQFDEQIAHLTENIRALELELETLQKTTKTR